MSAFAWVTLATNDSYALGALVLAHSLRKVGTAHQLAVMVTPGVTSNMREQLTAVFNLVHEVNVLDSHDASNLALLARPELGITFTKIHCWTLTQYSKCVFMDADTMVLQACDELFDREELSAAPDVGWPDCFNSGVFVYQPSMDTYKKILDFALAQGSFDGGDQGLLNMFFSNWSTQDSSRRLPFIYNMCSTAVYSYLPAFKQFGSDAKIIHFIGPMKPWLLELDTQTGLVSPSQGYEHLRPILQQWWSIFLAQILPKLQPDMGGMAGALASLSIGTPRSEQQIVLEDYWRRQAWEHGTIDYLGKDAFDKIWAKIQDTLQGVQPSDAGDAPSAPAPPSPDTAPPLPTEAPSPPQPVEVPTASLSTPVEAVSVAPTSPPPGDQKTPAPTVQPSPIASATPPLDASAPPVSQTAPASVELSTVTPCELAPVPPPLRPLSSSTVICTIPTTQPLSTAQSSPITAKPVTTPPISSTPIPLPFTSVSSFSTSKAPTPPSPPALPPSSPPAIPSAPAVPSFPPVIPSSPDVPSSPPDVPSSPPVVPSSPPVVPSSPPAIPLSPPTKSSSPPAVLSFLPTIPSPPPAVPPSPPATPISPPAKSSPPAVPSPPPAVPPSPPATPVSPSAKSSPPAVPSSPPAVPSSPPAISSPPAKSSSPPATLASPGAEVPSLAAALHSTSTQQMPSSEPSVPSASPRLIPQTPVVTDATPPTSPPIGLVTRSPEALAVGNVTPPETPPIGSGGNLQAAAENQSGAESAPIPPKRRGGPNKGGKSGQKGKK